MTSTAERPLPTAVLSPELVAQGVDLQANAAQYAEMQWQLSPERLREIEQVKAVLLDLPLVHSTKRDVSDMQAGGLLPYARRPEGAIGTSGDLDESLGLTEYAFMHWGAVEKSRYGTTHILINPQLLLDPATVVTPHDIGSLCYADGARFEDIDPEKQQAIQGDYLNKMVSGADWLEIVARRVAERDLRTDGLVTLRNQATLGEIKYHGVVDPSMFDYVVSAEQEQAFWKFSLEHGFLQGPVARAIPYAVSEYDKSPEQLGTTVEAGREFWRQSLVAAQQL